MAHAEKQLPNGLAMLLTLSISGGAQRRPLDAVVGRRLHHQTLPAKTRAGVAGRILYSNPALVHIGRVPWVAVRSADVSHARAAAPGASALPRIRAYDAFANER